MFIRLIRHFHNKSLLQIFLIDHHLSILFLLAIKGLSRFLQVEVQYFDLLILLLSQSLELSRLVLVLFHVFSGFAILLLQMLDTVLRLFIHVGEFGRLVLQFWDSLFSLE